MTIESISTISTTMTTMVAQPSCCETTEPQEATTTNEPVTVVDEPVLEETAEEEKAKGVLRLLQKGHFKGVADLRLRINFMDEIQEMEVQNLIESAQEGFEEFNQTVQQESTTLSESGLLDESQAEALDTFIANAETAQAEFLESEDKSVETLVINLQSNFDSLVGVLNTPSEPAERDSGTIDPETQVSDTPVTDLEPTSLEINATEIGPEAVSEDPAETSNPLDELVQNLQEVVQSMMDKLASDLSGTTVFGPVSEPTGNGKAYAKFLSIYEDMLNPPTEDTETEPIEPLDAQEVIGSLETTEV